jgi:hypothetical protein
VSNHIHLNLDEEIRELLQAREKDTVFQAICRGNPKALDKLHRSDTREPVRIDPYDETPAGPRQVESLLQLVVGRSLERALEDAEADNLVYDQLGEHRILGTKKKKKGKNRSC